MEERNNTTKYGFKTDHIKLEETVTHDMDQNSVSTLCDFVRKNKVLLTKANVFQYCYVESWNINTNEYSQVMYLDLSKFDEISNDDCTQMLIEMLHDYSLIEKDMNKTGHYKLVNNIGDRRLRIYGDYLLMEKYVTWKTGFIQV